MPIVQVLIISLLGAVLASGYCNVLTTDARKHMNKVHSNFHSIISAGLRNSEVSYWRKLFLCESWMVDFNPLCVCVIRRFCAMQNSVFEFEEF